MATALKLVPNYGIEAGKMTAKPLFRSPSSTITGCVETHPQQRKMEPAILPFFTPFGQAKSTP